MYNHTVLAPRSPSTTSPLSVPVASIKGVVVQEYVHNVPARELVFSAGAPTSPVKRRSRVIVPPHAYTALLEAPRMQIVHCCGG